MSDSPSLAASSVKLKTGQSSLRTAFTRAFAGNVFYTACQGAMTVALARLGPPELLGLFGLGIAVTAPIVEFFGLQLQVVESVDTRQKHRFHDYFRLTATLAQLSLLVLCALAWWGPYRGTAAWVILACGLSKIIEAASLVCHGKMQQVERTDLIATSLALRGISGFCALTLGVWLSTHLVVGVWALSLAWFIILLCYDWPQAHALQLRNEPHGFPSRSETNEPTSAAAEYATTGRVDIGPSRAWSLKRLFPRQRLWELAWTALPLGLFVGINALVSNAPRYFVENSLGARELGIFSALAYLGLAARAFYTSFLNAVLARLAEHHHQGEFAAFLGIIARAFMFIVTLGCVGCLAAFLLGDYCMLLFGNDYVGTKDVLVLLTAAMAFKTLWMLFVSALYAMQQFRLILLLQTMGGMILFTLLWKWVASGGLLGTAWAILVSAVVDCLLFSVATCVLFWLKRDPHVKLHTSI